MVPTMKEIKINTLPCGSINVKPSDACISDRAVFQKRTKLPVNVFLIQHPEHGNILIDTGLNSLCRSFSRQLNEIYQPEVSPNETAVSRLKELGLRPEDIDVLLLTHLDADCTCALPDFAGRARRIVCAELEYFYSCRTVYKKREFWPSWQPYVSAIERIHYRSSVLGPVGRGFDLFGDDSILCIYCPGHTDGIFSVIINQGPSNRFKTHGDGLYGGDFVLIASDLAFSQRNIDELSVPGSGFDRSQQLNALRFLRELQQEPHHFATLFSHSAPLNKTIILK